MIFIYGFWFLLGFVSNTIIIYLLLRFVRVNDSKTYKLLLRQVDLLEERNQIERSSKANLKKILYDVNKKLKENIKLNR